MVVECVVILVMGKGIAIGEVWNRISPGLKIQIPLNLDMVKIYSLEKSLNFSRWGMKQRKLGWVDFI